MPEQTFDAAAYTALGTARERVALPATTFDGTINMPVMHAAVKAYLANQRQANASTKTRGLVIGGNQKPWKQKGTGRARQGSIRAPNWPGGGTVFGPGGANYTQELPRKVRALARRSAFNARAREGAISVIDVFSYSEPRTKALRALTERLGFGAQKVLVLTDGVKQNVHLSGRNLPNVHVMPFGDASTYHILWSDVLLIEATAIGHTLAPVAEQDAAAAPRKAKAAPAAAPRQKSAAKPAAKKTAAKAAPKKAEARPAAKKSAAKKRAVKSAPKKKKGA